MAEAAYAPVEQTLAPVVGPTPEEIERRKLMAAALLKNAMGSEPIGHWTQGVSNMVQALIAGRMEKKAGEADAAAQAQAWQDIAGFDFTGGYGGDTGGGETADVPGAEAVSSAPDAATMQHLTGDGYVQRVQGLVNKWFPQYGHDPNIGFKVARSEGAAPNTWQSRVPTKGGGRETSFGPFQLLVGGGLGDRFIKETGLDPRDPSTLEEQIKFVARVLPETGWSPWYGAAKVGVDKWQGIGRGRARPAPAGETADIPGAEPVGSEPPADVAQFLGGAPSQPSAPGPGQASLTERQALIAKALGGPTENPADVAADVRKYYANKPPPPPRPPQPVGETAGIPGTEPIGFAPSPDVMAHITGRGATPAGLSIQETPLITGAPPSAGAGTVPLPPVATPPAPVVTPPVHPLARVPQARPEPPVAPAAPATTGAVAAPMAPRPVYAPPVKNDYATVPGLRPSVAPVRPGQLMNEPYPGVMSAQEFARQGQAAMRARAAGQQPVGVSPTGQPPQPRRNLLQALLGRGGPQGPASPPAAPAPSAAPAGGAVAPVDARRAQIASLLSNPRVPDALKLAALKSLTPQERDPFTLGPGQVRYGPDGQPVAAVPATPEKREKATDANGIPRWVDTGEPVFSGDVAGGKAPPKITDVAAMRKELHGLDTYKRYAKAAPVFNSLSESFGKNTRAGDLDFVYAMATIFDPESVVREGEQILVRNTANLPDQVVNGISSLMSGTGQLDEETRRNLYDVVHGRMQQYREAADTELAGFPEMAGRWGIDPADIMPNLMELKTLPEGATESEPEVGDTATNRTTGEVRRWNGTEWVMVTPPSGTR